jgi:hypothetical protein
MGHLRPHLIQVHLSATIAQWTRQVALHFVARHGSRDTLHHTDSGTRGL